MWILLSGTTPTSVFLRFRRCRQNIVLTKVGLFNSRTPLPLSIYWFPSKHNCLNCLMTITVMLALYTTDWLESLSDKCDRDALRSLSMSIVNCLVLQTSRPQNVCQSTHVTGVESY